jgi:hypothetical protein
MSGDYNVLLIVVLDLTCSECRLHVYKRTLVVHFVSLYQVLIDSLGVAILR